MSTKFLGKLATGVALGSAALLFSAPGIAFADDAAAADAAKHDPKDKAVTDSGIRQAEKSAFNSAQNNESANKVIAKAEKTAVAVNVPIQINVGGLPFLLSGLADGNLSCTNGVSDAILESAGEIQSLGEAAEFLQLLDSECNGDWRDGKGKGKGKHSKADNVVPLGEVAAGDGGAMTPTGAGGAAAAGLGMLGAAALSGTVLLRRRAADEPVA